MSWFSFYERWVRMTNNTKMRAKERMRVHTAEANVRVKVLTTLKAVKRKFK